MVVLAPTALLAAWERMRDLPPVQRPAELLRAFGMPRQDSVGRRDAALLEGFAENFGPLLEGLARCPGCGTEVELSVPVAELTAGMPPARAVEPVDVGGRTLRWRLPDDDDLAAAARTGSAERGALVLLSRCVSGDARTLDATERAALAALVAAADPFADITFALTCPCCAQVWEAALDPAEFAWARLVARARRLLGEVDELARAYGWSERQILALPQARRDSYLELVRHG
ncbi:hypothetical protein [Spongiactinospora sp. TRM90649]|uniref:hypothetical protein n=1 Tax=Spongiactinospora sp. TRM90649 TaxID=3031114 RepID=UPI0023FA4887|nr:hypothetical protein [Spongiactinospora sp. TRM90649]MDF5753117.1 hypothetical protein [Spongiactinospora sp. TRM90649]